MEIEIILHQMLQFFIVMFLGYLLFKVKLLDHDFIRKLTKLLLNVTLPATIFSSVLESDSERDTGAVIEVFLIGLAVYIVLPLISLAAVKLMRLPKQDRGLYAFMMTYSNIGFMGFPLMEALFGHTAVFYAAIVNVLFNISVFTCGVVMMNRGKAGGSEGKLKWKNLLSPGVSISVLAIIVYFLDVSFPKDVSSVVSSVGAITTPLAMILIGANLASMDLKSIFNDWHVYIYSLVKQAILPLLLWPVLKMCIADEFILNIIYILLLMPVANTSVLFATEYDGDEHLAAKTVFITTAMSIVTVPLLLMVSV